MTTPQRDAVGRVLAKWQARLGQADDVLDDYTEHVQVFGATCLRVPVVVQGLRNRRFDWVIVDEAAKATPTEVLVSLVVGQRFILVGDHRQLPPFLDTASEQDVARAGLPVERARRSLFEDIFDRVPSSNRATLRRQFRMHRSVGDFVGRLFYPEVGGLETGVADAERTVALSLFDRDHRVFWLDVSGRDKREGTSSWNAEEIDAIARLLDLVERELCQKRVAYDAGIIAAYAAQARRLQRRLTPNSKKWSALNLAVDTVDAFQGKQADVVVYSMVRAAAGEAKFISDPRRLNVAFSRAKRLLVIVGDRAGAERNPQLAAALALIPRENILQPGALR